MKTLAYRYRGINVQGATVTGSVQARTERTARALLADQRIHVEVLTRPWYAHEFGEVRPSRGELINFARSLAGLISTRQINVAEALEFLCERMPSPGMRRVVEEMAVTVIGGQTLSRAMAKYPATFPSLMRELVAAGEAASELPTMLQILARIMERTNLLTSRMATAMIYPGLLMLTLGAAIAVILRFVIPALTPLFDAADMELPLSTRIMIDASDWFRRGAPFLLGLFAWLLLFGAKFRRHPALRAAFDAVSLRIPMIGDLVRLTSTALLCEVLGTLYANRFEGVEALRIAVQTIDNTRIRNPLEAVLKDIVSGRGITASLEASGVVPDDVLLLAAAGERSGTLDAQLLAAARDFNLRAETSVERISKVVPNLLVLASVILIGATAWAIQAPLLGALRALRM